LTSDGSLYFLEKRGIPWSPFVGLVTGKTGVGDDGLSKNAKSKDLALRQSGQSGLLRQPRAAQSSSGQLRA